MHNSVIQNGLANGFLIPMTSVVRENIDKFVVAGKGVSLHVPHAGSCLNYAMTRYVDFFINGAKVYSPVHIVLLLIKLSRGDGKIKEKIIRAVKGLIKSCLFCATMSLGVPSAGCHLKGLINPGFLSEIDVFLESMAFSFFFLFESSSRWAEMSIWVLANWTASVKYMLEKRGRFPQIPYLEVR